MEVLVWCMKTDLRVRAILASVTSPRQRIWSRQNKGHFFLKAELKSIRSLHRPIKATIRWDLFLVVLFIFVRGWAQGSLSETWIAFIRARLMVQGSSCMTSREGKRRSVITV